MIAARTFLERGRWVTREVDLPVPLWWRLLRNATSWAWLCRLANHLYAWRYGFWAPCLEDCCSAAPLHGLSSAVHASWGKGS